MEMLEQYFSDGKNVSMTKSKIVGNGHPLTFSK